MADDKALDGRDEAATILFAFYDLSIAPAGLEVLNFLALAELARLEAGCDMVHLVLVPDEAKKSQADADRHFWTVKNEAIQCTTLYPRCRQFTLCASRQQAEEIYHHIAEYVFPEHYTLDAPKALFRDEALLAAMDGGDTIPPIQLRDQAAKYVTTWITERAGDKPVVCLSLFEDHEDLQPWSDFACSLPEKGYFPMVVRDIDAAMRLPPENLFTGLNFFNEATVNLEIRTALYHIAKVNVFSPGAPWRLATFDPEAVALIALDTHLPLPAGVEPGGRSPRLGANQDFIWAEDKILDLDTAFDALIERL